jgi:hypothetical protein
VPGFDKLRIPNKDKCKVLFVKEPLTAEVLNLDYKLAISAPANMITRVRKLMTKISFPNRDILRK